MTPASLPHPEGERDESFLCVRGLSVILTRDGDWMSGRGKDSIRPTIGWWLRTNETVG